MIERLCVHAVGHHSCRQIALVIYSRAREEGKHRREETGSSLRSLSAQCQRLNSEFILTTPHIWNSFLLHGHFCCSCNFSIQLTTPLSLLFLTSLRLCVVFVFARFILCCLLKPAQPPLFPAGPPSGTSSRAHAAAGKWFQLNSSFWELRTLGKQVN